MSLGVTFVVPVYNKARYLPSVLDAIRRQRGAFAREYVLVDDGSTDGSLALIREITRDWPDVTIVEQDNRGSAHATNRGIERARQPFIKLVDADDLLAADATRLLLEALVPTDACLAFGGRRFFADPTELDLAAPLEAAGIRRIEEPLLPAIRNSMFNPSQCLVRTDRAREVGGCDERVVHSQEYSLTLRLARRWPFLALDTELAFLPLDVPGRLSGTEPSRQLQRVTLAVGLFVQDHPDLPVAIRRYACRRAASRAWKYQQRMCGASPLSHWFRRYVAALAGLHADGAFIAESARAFASAPAR
jgi:hypothetical protein